MSTPTTTPTLDFSGELLHPGDPGFDEVASIFNGMIDRRPSAIARCRTPTRSRRAVRGARAAGLDFTVRGGGHGVSGAAVADGALMIDLAPMKQIDVDVDARRATVAAGATWADARRGHPGARPRGDRRADVGDRRRRPHPGRRERLARAAPG